MDIFTFLTTIDYYAFVIAIVIIFVFLSNKEKMNFFASLTFIIIGALFFLYTLTWLGIVFIALGLIALTFREEKNFWKTSWEEASKAEGSYPAGKMKEYTKNAAKQFANWTDNEKTKYDVATAPRKLNKASKSVLDEFGNLFK